MVAGVKLTTDSLERRLRREFISRRTTLSVGKLPHKTAAAVQKYSDGKAEISLDQHKIGRLEAVVHELVHVVLDERFKDFSAELSEELIEALEECVCIKIEQSRKRSAWWRAAIAEKATASKSTAGKRTAKGSRAKSSAAGSGSPTTSSERTSRDE